MKYLTKDNYRRIEEMLKYAKADKNEMLKKYGTSDLLDVLIDEDKIKWNELNKSIHHFEEIVETMNRYD